MPTRDQIDHLQAQNQNLWEQNRKKAAQIQELRAEINAERKLSDGYARTIINSEAEIHALRRQKQFLLDLLTPEQLKAAFLAVLEDM